MHNPKYKTTLCKHFDTPQGCSYGDKCQFAHGAKELRSNNFHSFPMPMGGNSKNQNNMMNYKIVKCKNFEKDGTCKYGDHCTFAHGEKEIRNKAQNLYQINNTGNDDASWIRDGGDAVHDAWDGYEPNANDDAHGTKYGSKSFYDDEYDGASE